MNDNEVVKNEMYNIKENLFRFFFVELLMIYLGFLCGAVWTPKSTLDGYFADFYQFIIVEHHFIVGTTKMTGVFILIFSFIWAILFMFTANWYAHPFENQEYGDAKWGDIETYDRLFANHDETNEVEVNFGDVERKKNFLETVGLAEQQPFKVNTRNYWIAEGVYVNLDNENSSNLNGLIIGPPGTGKTFRVIRPLLSMLTGSEIVTDPKGELRKETGQYKEDNGYGVFVIDIESEESMKHSHHINFFKYIHNESGILSIMDILFKASSNEDATSQDPFFENMAQILCTAIMYLMFYTYPEQDRDWRHFVELLDSTGIKTDPKTGAIDNSDPNCILQRFEAANKLWHEGKFTDGVEQEEDLKGLVDVRKIYSGAAETASSIVSSLDSHAKYMRLDCVKELLSDDDLDIVNTFGYGKPSAISPTGKYILYIVTSESDRFYDWITSVIYALVLGELYHLTVADDSLHGRLKNHLTMLMDEFNNVVPPDGFVDKTSTMRSKEISVMVVVQNLLQLKHKFPKDEMDKNLVSNMNFMVILGAPDWQSCKDLSEMFGKMTIRKKSTGTSQSQQNSYSENEDVMEKPLLPPEKIYRMKKNGPCAILIKGSDPLWVNKVQFQNSPLCPLLTRRTPYKIKRRDSKVKTKYDFNKSPCEQIPVVYSGREAEKMKAQCEHDGIEIIKISADDVDAMSVLSRNKEPLVGLPGAEGTESFWRHVRENSKRILEEQKNKTIDYNDYDDEQVLLVQRLRNEGYEVFQIKALSCLILAGSDYKEISTYFNSRMSVGEITDFAERLASVKLKHKKKAV